jgi:hypothetical protein
MSLNWIARPKPHGWPEEPREHESPAEAIVLVAVSIFVAWLLVKAARVICALCGGL